MMYRCLLLMGSLVGIVQASGVSSEPLSIRVIDEYNKGVFSRVYYGDGTHRHSFFVTDHEGKAQQTPSECGKISILRARPYDSEAYFDSIAQPCMSKIVLRVLHKQTPTGRAISLQTISFSLPDGSAGVLAIKVVLKSTSQDLADPQKDHHCEFTLSAFAHQQVFRVEGENWVGYYQSAPALCSYFSGNFAQAVVWIRKTPAPGNPNYHLIAAAIYAEAGLDKETVREREWLLENAPKLVANIRQELAIRIVDRNNIKTLISSFEKAGLMITR